MRFEPVYIATSIIVCAFGGFLWSSWGIAQLNWEGSWLLALKIFHHGCEGALVGGICDFIAVHNVYDAARREFPALRDNTAKVVIKDMIHLQAEIKQAAQLDILLHDPEKQEAFIYFIREFIPEKKTGTSLSRGSMAQSCSG